MSSTSPATPKESFIIDEGVENRLSSPKDLLCNKHEMITIGKALKWRFKKIISICLFLDKSDLYAAHAGYKTFRAVLENHSNFKSHVANVLDDSPTSYSKSHEENRRSK